MAARLRKEMYQGSMAARWSGDKFAIIFPNKARKTRSFNPVKRLWMPLKSYSD